MLDAETINKKLESAGYKPQDNKHILKHHQTVVEVLMGVLHEEENVLDVVNGLCNNTLGLAIATDKRLLFAGTMGAVHKTTIEDLSYDKISSVNYTKGWLPTASLFFTVSGNKMEISGIKPDAAQHFRTTVNGIKDKPVSAQTKNTNVSMADELEKLVSLKERGILTETEFTQQKMKLLGL